MNVLIIEDEKMSAHLLQDVLADGYDDVIVLATLHSVREAVDWIGANKEPDLIFMDIQLPDGLGFDILKQTSVSAPIIFTTAHDQYALEAFKVNSLDYLLKPVNITELDTAVRKYQKHHSNRSVLDSKIVEELIRSLSQPKYRERFMTKSGQNLNFVMASDLHFAYAEDGLVFLVSADGKKHHVDHRIEDLQGHLNPQDFFRVNRKYLVRINAIQKIQIWFNSRLKLDVQHADGHEIIVSRERVADFKVWLGQ